MFKKLFFKIVDESALANQTFSVTLRYSGRKEIIPPRRLTPLQEDAVHAAFRFFNETRFEAVYALDIDGGITDGIMRAAIHHDLVQD